MNLKPKRPQAEKQQPHAQADIADLQAWAAGDNSPPTPRAEVPTQRDGGRDAAPAGLANHPMMPKVLVIAGVVIVGYLVIAVVVHLLMMLLMIVGGIAAVYAAYRIGFWRGQRSTEPVRTMPWPGSGRRRD